ncbi:hypothetical protein JOH51_006729 [Rhizobium leguminosarum]|nr:hypothetical protein [Rhizobium leguminosarum]
MEPCTTLCRGSVRPAAVGMVEEGEWGRKGLAWRVWRAPAQAGPFLALDRFLMNVKFSPPAMSKKGLALLVLLTQRHRLIDAANHS